MLLVWPPSEDPQRPPYRGWAPFEDIDAGVFFGRDAAIAGGLDDLRAMRFGLLARLSGYKSLFVVLGPSGSGKSSFLRAGLIPRLRRDDRRFLVLGLMRPEHRLTGDHGLAAAIHSARVSLGLPSPPLGDIKSACVDDPDWVCELLVELRVAAAKRLADIEPDETTRLNPRRRAARPRRASRASRGPKPTMRPWHRRWCCRWIRPRNCSPPTLDRRPDGF